MVKKGMLRDPATITTETENNEFSAFLFKYFEKLKNELLNL
jgi:hypothetical protein